MIQISQEKIYQDGQIIFQEGGFEEYIYILKTGSVELSKKVENYRTVIDRLYPGEIFGGLGFLAQAPHSISAKAIGVTTLQLIDSKILSDEFNKLSTDFQKILISLASRLVETTDKALKAKLRRSNSRVQRNIPIKYKDFIADQNTYTDNLSQGGIFIKTDNPLQVGTSFFINLHMPDEAEALKIQCEVSWNRVTTNNPVKNPLGMGAKFIQISRDNHMKLERIYNESLKFNKTKEKVVTKIGTIKIETITIENPVKPPIFFAPGFSTTLKLTSSFRKQLASKGYPVISLEYPRNWLKPKLARLTVSFQRLRPVILGDVFKHLQKKNLKNLIVIGHSCGAIDITEAILKKQFNMISSIILANPAGMTVGCEKSPFINRFFTLGHNLYSYLENTVKEAVDYMPSNLNDALLRYQWLLGCSKDIVKNPLEAGKDMFRIINANIVPGLLEIKKKGINTMLYVNKDRIFPLNEILKHANQELIPVAVYSGSKKTHHDIVLNNKESVNYIVDLIQFQEVMNALTDKDNLENSNIFDSMLNTKLFDLDVIYPKFIQ